MPKRRPEDVVHVVVTDHRIQRRPPDGLLAARSERDPVLTGAVLLEPQTLSSDAERALYRLAALARVLPGKEAVERLAAQLAAGGESPREARFDLALGALQQRRYADAETVLRGLDSGADPASDGMAREWLAVAQAMRGEAESAVGTLRRALSGPNERAESRYNLGRLLLAQGDAAGARTELRRAVELRPNLAAAWLRLGDAERALAATQESGATRERALEAYRQALALNPRMTAVYLALGDFWLEDGKRDDALRILRHGAEHAEDAQSIGQRLATLEKN
jgi:tetratricopeptide (TPR) repeat protein